MMSLSERPVESVLSTTKVFYGNKASEMGAKFMGFWRAVISLHRVFLNLLVWKSSDTQEADSFSFKQLVVTTGHCLTTRSGSSTTSSQDAVHGAIPANAG